MCARVRVSECMEIEEKGACESRGVPLHIHAPQDLECGGSCRRVSSHKSSVTSEMISLCVVRYGGLYAHKPSFEGCYCCLSESLTVLPMSGVESCGSGRHLPSSQ